MSNSKPWLETVYRERKIRTIKLINDTVVFLNNSGKKISLSSIVAASKIVDEKGHGISSSAILANKEAKEIYENSRTWKAKINAKKHVAPPLNLMALPLRLKHDSASTYRRLSKLTKKELIDRLILIENSYAMLHREWISIQNEKLNFLLSSK